MDQQIPDFGKIMRIAQQVASQIEPPAGLKSGGQMDPAELTNVISQITKSVGEIVTPEMLAGQFSEPVNDKQSNKKKSKGKGKDSISKISFNQETVEDITEELVAKECETGHEVPKEENKPDKRKKRYVEIVSTDEESEDDTTIPRTKDMAFTLTVTLDELFTGTKKKLALRRQKIDSDGSTEEEKKKLSIKIEPGMIEEQIIRFNHMADEKQGYETGDVVVSLDVEEHAEFTRIGNDLIIDRDISLAEAYSPVVFIRHLSGKNFKISGPPIDIFNNPDDDTMKKIRGLGMPVAGDKGEFGDLYIKFNCVNKTKMTPEIIETLKGIFPPLVKPFVVDESETIYEADFEMVTESDLEYLESESESDSDDYDSGDSDDESGEDSESEPEKAKNTDLD